MINDRRDPHAELLALLRVGPVSWDRITGGVDGTPVVFDLVEAGLVTMVQEYGRDAQVVLVEKGTD